MSLKKLNEDYRIVVLDRGNVLVGQFEQLEEGCVLRNASVIRRWGTSKGLGELVKNGPLPNTILDECNGVVRFREAAVLFTIDTEANKWIK